MNFEEEISALSQRILNEDLFDRLLQSYLDEEDKDPISKSENDYTEGRAALTAALSPESLKAVEKLEQLYHDYALQSMRYAFQRGIYGGFQQYLDPEASEQPFQTLVIEAGAIQGTPLNDARSLLSLSLEQPTSALQAVLNAELNEHLISIDAAWEDRAYGIMRHAFYLGYRITLRLLTGTEPYGVLHRMQGKLLLTEYELGFLVPRRDREVFRLGESDA